MSNLSEFFLNSDADIVLLELFEITHASFSTTYRIVRNAREGVTVYVDSAYQTFLYYPVRIEAAGKADNNLDYALKIDIGDLGSIVAPEVDAVINGASSTVMPQLRYWNFRSDNLAAAIFGPVTLVIKSLAMTREGVSFLAMAPQLNSHKTGELYTVERFPTLRSLL